MSKQTTEVPICVDLDGTLSRSDSLWEAVLMLLRATPWLIIALPWWLLKGKAAFKARIATSIKAAEMELPWNDALLEYLRRSPRQPVYLVSGADQAIVSEVARRWPQFAGYFASDGTTNLTGAAKAKLLVERFGEKGFDYAGNERKDFAIWAWARSVVVVNASARLVQEAKQQFTVAAVIGEERIEITKWVKCLRPHQWVKNLLVFVPLFTAHLMSNGGALGRAVLAFLAFCGLASAFYIFNDLLDLQSDRKHPDKRLRPLPAGEVPIPSALGLMAACLGVGVVLGAVLGGTFGWALLGYAGLNGLYTVAFKRLPIADVLVLGALYTMRIVGGAVATSVALSSWLLIFSLFIFLSLGMAKRYTELKANRDRGKEEVAGRGYHPDDLEFVSSLGIASGYISTLVFALYISSDNVKGLYRHPQVLWAFVVLLLYWISRVWLIAHRGQLNHDPIIFALKDRVSYGILACALVVVYLAGPITNLPGSN
jgi:4-hydroxybenzoate polyprenyltransferase